MNQPGKLISLEGIEGCGKSTQSRLLYDYLVTQGKEVIMSREPGGTAIGDGIRDILLRVDYKHMDAKTEALLYAASRSQLIDEIVAPAIAAGRIVILDRYIDSTYAYQIYGRGLEADTVKMFNEWAISGFKPDITFLLDLEVEEGFARLQDEDPDRIESESIEFHRRVAAGFHNLAAAEPGRWRIIDASLSPSAVHQEIIQHLSEVLTFAV